MDADLVAGDGAVADVAEPPNPIHGVLTTCGITNAAHRDVFIGIEQGLNSITAFASMSGDTDVTEMANKRMASRPNAAADRVILGTLQIKRLQALVFWVKDYDKRGMEAAPELRTEEVMSNAMIRKEAEYNYGKIDVDINDPDKCQTDHGWDNWQLAFVTSLMQPWELRTSLSTTLRAQIGTKMMSSS